MPLLLVLKAFVFGSLIASTFFYSWFFGLFAIFWILFVYSRGAHRGRLAGSLITLCFVSFVFGGLSGGITGGILFFLLIGVKEFAFIRYDIVYYAVHAGLVFSLIFFLVGAGGSFLAAALVIAGILFFLLFREVISWMEHERHEGMHAPVKKDLLAAGVILLAFEALWVLAYLPLSPLHTALLVLFFVLVAEDFLFRFLRGGLSRGSALRNITALILLTLGIFGMTSWSP